MIFNEDDVLYIHRGDDAVIPFYLEDHGEPYPISDGDTITLTVRRTPNATGNPIFSKTFEASEDDEDIQLVITRAESLLIPTGIYSADIVFTRSSPSASTVVWPKPTKGLRGTEQNLCNFVVMAGVKDNG